MRYTCSSCNVHACNKNNLERAPKNCPSLNDGQEIEKVYLEEENYKIAQISAEIVMENYGEKTRIVEIIDFAKRCEYKNIGLAFCIGLQKEASVVEKIFRQNGLQVEAIICKVGAVDRELIGIEDCEVPMCNPIAQAEYLNDRKTDLNVILGLCVGHDSLFFKYSKAPVTVLAVKDRVLGNNPLKGI
ncbi:MAG: DUF1847 domain-containing protein [Clostridium sp.]|uniref:DUF1847 domain-containing protein n=1 Tax=Clostridium sp. TaxID=1506 RepID=UPI003F3EB40D